MNQRLNLVLNLVLVSSLFLAASANAQVLSYRDSPAAQKIHQRLDQEVTLEFVETSLVDVVEFLRTLTGVNMVLDVVNLEDEGITIDTPVTIHVEKIRLRSALNLVLEALHSTWVIENDALTITTEIAAQSRRFPKLYQLGEVTNTTKDGASLQNIALKILDVSEAPDAQVHYLPSVNAMMVNCDSKTHQLISDLLRQIAKSDHRDARVESIREKLRLPVTLEFVATSLADVVEFLRTLTGTNFVLDQVALEDEGITRDTPISIDVKNISLGSALTLVLDQLQSTYIIKNGCVVITSKLQAEFESSVRVYSVEKVVGNRPEAIVSMLSGVLPRPERSIRPSFDVGDLVKVRQGDQLLIAGILELKRVKDQELVKVQFKSGNDSWVDWITTDSIVHSARQPPSSEAIALYYAAKKCVVVYCSQPAHEKVVELLKLTRQASEAATDE